MHDVKFELSRAKEELAEAEEAFDQGLPTFGEELADVVIFIMAAAEFSNVDLEHEILAKIAKNVTREPN